MRDLERPADGSPPALQLLGKGRRERERLVLASESAASIAEWLIVRG